MKKILKHIKDDLILPHLILFIFAPVTNLIVETLSRRNVFGGVIFLYQHPFIFLYNSLIILFTLLVSLIFVRKMFVMTIISLIWIAFGITNCILLGYRTTPFNANDLKITTFDIIWMYVSDLLIPVILGVALLTGLLVLLWKKLPKKKTKFRYSLIFILFISAALFISTTAGTSSGKILTTFPNIANAYRDYGFPYCFSCSIVDRGIDKPSGYSEDTIADIVAKYDKPNNDPEDRPNIILIQLESFFDPKRIKGIKFSEDPIPNFTRLKSEGSGGFVVVPSISAGTANTEFEILASMSLDYFGPGEYPFSTILKQTTCESICYDLKEYGYSCHAVHNNLGTFYSRSTSYKNLGFDSYTSIEYMNNITYNHIGWAEDKILTKHIFDAFESTPEQQDFVFTVTVQGHGKYPNEYEYELPVTITGHKDKFTGTPFTYFVNQLYETDAFIGELAERLRNSDEHTILIMYGDHLPGLNVTDEDLIDGSVFNSDYLIWANYDFEPDEASEPDEMYAFQFCPYFMNLMGMDSGNMNKLSQYCREDPSYDRDMLMLQYDILYGKQYCLGGKKLKQPKMHMGVLPIIMTGFSYKEDGTLIVSGTNFTESSKIFINEDVIEDTVWAGDNLVYARGVTLKDGDVITVKQYTTTGRKLSKTEPFTYYEPVAETEETATEAEDLPDEIVSDTETAAVEETLAATIPYEVSDETVARKAEGN
ncbi:MAG: sulfatase-like hydrolase/transferase [Clostridia bacterium]|nr:sulfatase-like hydrolase/transferase [Clostridia bacterium]